MLTKTGRQPIHLWAVYQCIPSNPSLILHPCPLPERSGLPFAVVHPALFWSGLLAHQDCQAGKVIVISTIKIMANDIINTGGNLHFTDTFFTQYLNWTTGISDWKWNQNVVVENDSEDSLLPTLSHSAACYRKKMSPFCCNSSSVWFPVFLFQLAAALAKSATAHTAMCPCIHTHNVMLLYVNLFRSYGPFLFEAIFMATPPFCQRAWTHTHLVTHTS